MSSAGQYGGEGRAIKVGAGHRQIDHPVAHPGGGRIGDGERGEGLDMIADRLRVEGVTEHQRPGDAAADAGRGDRARGLAGRRVGRDEAAVLVLFPRGAGGEGAARSAPRLAGADERVEAPQPFVAVEAADAGVGDGAGMVAEALA